MNKIYKVIYNRTLGRYEVVSELAKNRGKANTSVRSSVTKTLRGVLASVTVFVLMGGRLHPLKR